MRFFELADLYIEAAKGGKGGERFLKAQQQSGPSGLSRSPVGTDRYNPLVSEPDKRPADTKAKSVRRNEIILRNCFRIIKGDIDFRKRLNTILEQFVRKRKQIRQDQETILTYNPGHIDKLFGQIQRHQKIIQVLDDDDDRQKEFQKELDEMIEKKAELELELDQIIAQMMDVVAQNEQASLEYQDKVIKVVQQVAEKEYGELLDTIGEEEKKEIVLRSLEDLDIELLDDEQFDQDLVRLEHLNLLRQVDDGNPLYQFFYLVNEQYEALKASDAFFKGLKRNTQNVTVELLWNRLPMNAFLFFYNATKEDMPLRRLTGQRRKQVKTINPIREMLSMIDSEQEFEKQRDWLRQKIGELSMDQGRRNAVMSILDGPYKRRGATAVQRLNGMLRGIMRESTETEDTFRTILANLGMY